MRNYLIALPILALSACSAIQQPYVNYTDDVNSGQYNQGCSAGTCAPGQSYSVASTPHNNVNTNHWPDQNLVSNYESGGAYGHGPQHINPTGYGPAGYGAQQALGYGQPPHIRGLRGQKRGNFYGTLGGVMYDTDIDSFGLQGRVGYNSGRGFLGAHYGAEVEGSIGLNDETIGDLGDFTDVNNGVDHSFGAYVISRLPLSQRFSIHSRVGYNSQKFTIDGTNIDGGFEEASDTLDGLAIGVGAEYALSPQSGLRIDYTESDSDIGTTKGIAASFVRKF